MVALIDVLSKGCNERLKYKVVIHIQASLASTASGACAGRCPDGCQLPVRWQSLSCCQCQGNGSQCVMFM